MQKSLLLKKTSDIYISTEENHHCPANQPATRGKIARKVTTSAQKPKRYTCFEGRRSPLPRQPVSDRRKCIKKGHTCPSKSQLPAEDLKERSPLPHKKYQLMSKQISRNQKTSPHPQTGSLSKTKETPEGVPLLLSCVMICDLSGESIVPGIFALSFRQLFRLGS